MIALLNTSLGDTRDASRVPIEHISIALTSFVQLSKRTPRFSLSQFPTADFNI